MNQFFPGKASEFFSSLTVNQTSNVKPVIRRKSLLCGALIAASFAIMPAHALKFSHEHVLLSPTSPDGGPANKFGFSADMEGDTAIVSDYNVNEVYTYERQEDGSWQYKQTLTPPTGGTYPAPVEFGHSIALDGDTIAVGDPSCEGVSGNDNSAGVVYLYQRQTDGTWSFQAMLGSQTDHDVSYDDFGQSVDMQDGVLVIGAPKDEGVYTTPKGLLQGAAYLYKQGVDGSWSFQKRLSASTPLDNSYLGMNVTTDGTRVIVGAKNAPIADVDDIGLAYIYDVDGAEVSLLRAPDGERNGGDKFGYGVEIFGDHAFVGAVGFDGATDAEGKVYAYKYNQTGSSWDLLTSLTWTDLERLDGFGSDIDFDGSDLVVGATNYADSLYYFSYDSSNSTFTPVRSWQADNFSSDVGQGLGMDQVRIDGSGRVLATARTSDQVMIYEPVTDVSLVVQDDTDPVEPETEFTYSLIATNVDAEVDATGVEINGDLPAGFSIVQNDTACTQNGITDISVTCNLDSLATTDTHTFEISVSAANEGNFNFTTDLTVNEWLVSGPVVSDTESTVVAVKKADEDSGGSMSWSFLLFFLFTFLRKRSHIVDELQSK